MMRAALIAALSVAVLLVLPAETRATNTPLNANVGPGFVISLTDGSDQPVTELPAGTYDIHITDQATIHNFDLCKVTTQNANCSSAGAETIDMTQIGTTTDTHWVVSLAAGFYHFQCDAHPTQLFGDFTVDPAGPTITPHVTPAPNAAGWNHTSVAVTWDVATQSLQSSTNCGETDLSTETTGTDVTCEATDDSGTSSKTVTVKIDETPPTTTIGAKPTNPSKSSSPSFSFSSNEGSTTFMCSLDGSAPALCTSPVTYSKIARRSHLFEVHAVDQAGNADQTPDSYAWTNGSAPKVGFTTKPPNPTGASATFAFASSDPNAVLDCHVDATDFPDCGSPFQVDNLGDGARTFTVVGTDAAGRSGKLLRFTWTVDTTAPDTTITKHPTDPTSSANAAFSFTSTEKKSTFECSLDSEPFGACPKKGYTGLAGGPHAFQVRATDAAGNTDPAPAEFDWTVTG